MNSDPAAKAAFDFKRRLLRVKRKLGPDRHDEALWTTCDPQSWRKSKSVV